MTTNTNSDPAPLSAVIDLGTNTFHLLIARITSTKKIVEVYRERIFVKLASDGIDAIGPAPFSRGISAIKNFKKILDEYKCTKIQALGTAALRRASNGQDFIDTVYTVSDIRVTLISGDEEARLITNGVLAAVPPSGESMLIMDIGGGSTEYIITLNEEVRWRQSFPIGISVLKDAFHRSDPISEVERAALNDHLTAVTMPLRTALSAYPTRHLTGAAGTFDLLADLLRDPEAPVHPTSHQLALHRFPALLRRISSSTAAARQQYSEIPSERVDMIVVAMLLLAFTIDLAAIERVTVSNYALKEGALLDS